MLSAACLWLGSAGAASLAFWGPGSPSFLLEGLLLVLLVSPAIVDIRRGNFDLFELRNLFCLGYFIQFVVSTWYSQFVEYRFVSESFFQTYLNQALTLAVIGLAAFYGGYYAPWGPNIASRLSPLVTRWRVARLPLIVIGFVMIAVGSWMILIELTGGLYFMLTHLYEITELVQGMTFLFSFTAGFFYGAIVLCELQSQETGSRKYKLAAGGLALANLIVLLTRGYKFPFAIVALVFWVSQHYLQKNDRQRPRKLWKVMIAVAVLALVPYYQLFRGTEHYALDGESLRALDVSWSNALPLIFRRYYGVEAFELIISKVGREVPYGMGWSMLLFFTNFIPRAFWPGKPLGPGNYEVDLFFTIRSKVMTGVEPSIPGELYWNLGIVGIVVGMAALGVLCRFVYVFFKRNQNRSGVMFYLPWVFWAFECNDGNLSDSLYSFIVVYLLPLVLAYLLLARGRAPQRQAIGKHVSSLATST